MGIVFVAYWAANPAAVFAASGSNLTFESRRGFPIELAYASLAHAYRDFHDR
jgi:hypothetical protein